MKIRPVGDRAVIETLPAETKTAGGIVLPDSAQEKPQQGRVLAVGPGKWENGSFKGMEVSVGDEIYFSKYSGTTIKLGVEEYVIVGERDILGVIEK